MGDKEKAHTHTQSQEGQSEMAVHRVRQNSKLQPGWPGQRSPSRDLQEWSGGQVCGGQLETVPVCMGQGRDARMGLDLCLSKL